MRAWGELDDYVTEMIERRRDTLSDDLLSDLIRVEDDGDRLSHSELLMLACGLLLAGTDTTRNQVAASIDVLSDHPDQWALLGDSPTSRCGPSTRPCATVRSSVPPCARRPRTSNWRGRLPQDTMVIVNTAVANRDPSIYDDPDRFDITRRVVPTILTFGAGMHYCLGANLARVEIAEALKTVTRQLTNPRKTGPAPWKPLTTLSGPTSLPIAFDA